MNTITPAQVILHTLVSQWTGRAVLFAGRTLGGWLTIRFADGTEVGTFTDKDGVANTYPALDLAGLWDAVCRIGEFSAECEEIELGRSETEERTRENDALLDDQCAKESKAVREAKCVACGETWVDVLNGEDTCKECLASA